MRGTLRALIVGTLLLGSALGVEQVLDRTAAEVHERHAGGERLVAMRDAPAAASASASAPARVSDRATGTHSSPIPTPEQEAEETPLHAEVRPETVAATASPPSSSLTWPILHPIEPDERHLTIRPMGADPIGGRRIDLFMRRDGRLFEVDRTVSEPNGHFAFGDIPAPDDAFELVVVAPGQDPASVSGLLIARPRPTPPAFRVARAEPGLTIRIEPTTVQGTIELIDASDRLIDVVDVVDAAGEISFALEPDELDQSLRVVHVLADGRSSRPRTVYQAPRRQAHAQATR